jgi:hypothetical protein
MPSNRRGRRTRLLLLLLAVVALLGVAYRVLTDPARLRRLALRALHDLPWGRVEVGEVTCSPFGELVLTDFSVRGRVSADAEGAPALRIRTARVACRLRDLLLGRVRPTEIELDGVVLALECPLALQPLESREARGAADAQRLTDWLTGRFGPLPSATVERGDVQVLTTEHGRPQLVERMLWRAEGRATPEGYELRLEHRPAAGQPLLAVQWDARAREFNVSGAAFDLRTLTQLAPERVAAALRPAALTGRVRVVAGRLRWPIQAAASTLQTLSTNVSQLDLAFEGGSFVAPIEPDGATPFVSLEQVEAVLRYRAAGAGTAGATELELAGSLRGAATTLRVQASADALAKLREANGENALDEISTAQLEVAGLELPTAHTFPAFVVAPRLPAPVVTLLRDYVPRGRVNLRLELLPPPAAGAARLVVDIEPLHAACRYARFPYPVEQVTGKVRLSEGRVLLDDLRGVHGDARIFVSGVLNSTRSWTGFDLALRGENVALDDDLYHALPPDQQALWQSAAPRGVADIAAQVSRPDGTAETGATPSQVNVAAHLLSGSLSLGNDDRLTQAAGWIDIAQGRVTVRDLRGRVGDASLRLDGLVAATGQRGVSDVQVHATAWPLTHDLQLGAADDGLRLHFRGHAAIEGRVFADPNDHTRRHDLSVAITDGEVTGPSLWRTWHVTGGRARVAGPRQELSELALRQGDARIGMSGSLPAGAAEPLTLDVRATTSKVEELYPQFVPRGWADRLSAFGLRGAAETTLKLRPAETDPAAVQEAELTVYATEMTPTALPLRLRDVTAELDLGPGRFQLRRATARCGPEGAIEARQAAPGRWLDGDLDAEFALAARRLALTPEVIGALPPSLSGLLARLAARGEFDLDLPTLRVTGAADRTWSLAGQLTLRDLELRGGCDLAAAAAQLNGLCEVAPGGDLTLDATFAIERGQLAGRAIEQWEGQLLRDPTDRWLRLERVVGRACGGVVQGSLWIDPAASDYELSVYLHDLAAADLLPEVRAAPDRPRPGRIAGELWLRGRLGDTASRRGGGTARVAGVTFVQTPVLVDILRLGRQGSADDRVNEADLRFRWEGRQIVFERIDIYSRDLQFVGSGHWDLVDDRLQLTLWAAHPDLWRRLGVLGDVIQAAGQELIQYRVEGPLGAPTITTEPLRRLNEALRRLLGEPR